MKRSFLLKLLLQGLLCMQALSSGNVTKESETTSAETSGKAVVGDGATLTREENKLTSSPTPRPGKLTAWVDDNSFSSSMADRKWNGDTPNSVSPVTKTIGDSDLVRTEFLQSENNVSSVKVTTGPTNTTGAPKEDVQNSEEDTNDENTGSDLSDPYRVLRTVTRITLILTGTLCNVFSAVVLLNRSLRNVSVNILTLGTTVANLILLMALLTTTPKVEDILPIPCRALVFPVRLGITWTTLTVAAVSVDRYIAVCLPLHRILICRPKWAIVVTIVLFITSLADATFQTLMVDDLTRGTGLGVIPGCHPSPHMLELQKVYYILHIIFVYALPWLIVCSLNICIIYSLQKQRRQWHTNSTAKCVGEFRVNVSLVVICVTFAILCLPDVAFMLLHSRAHIRTVTDDGSVDIDKDFQIFLREFGNCSYLLQTIIYPVALLSVGTNYRKVILKIVCRPQGNNNEQGYMFKKQVLNTRPRLLSVYKENVLGDRTQSMGKSVIPQTLTPLLCREMRA